MKKTVRRRKSRSTGSKRKGKARRVARRPGSARKAAAAKRRPAKKRVRAGAKKAAAGRRRVPLKKKAGAGKSRRVKRAGKTIRKAAKGKTAKRRPARRKTAHRVVRRRTTARKPAARKVARKTARRKPVRKALRRTARKPVLRPAARKAARKAAVRRPAPKPKRGPAVKPPFEAYTGSKSYIFASYSHGDMREVFNIIRKLNDGRFRIWYDEGIEPGVEWPEVVGKAILHGGQFMVFMSPSAVNSRNVRNEINLAHSESKNILVIFLRETRLSEGMMLQIGTVQHLNRFEMTEREFLDKLSRVLGSELRN
jgi:hypothetical protein